MAQTARKTKLKYTPRAEIARLLREPLTLRVCPEWDNPRALIEHGVATMIRLTEADNWLVASNAAQWLVSYGQNLQAYQKQNGKMTSQDHMEIVAELRTLYAKALPQRSREPQEPLVETVDAEVQPEPSKRS